MIRKVLLVKPPERSRFSFGAFSLAVLAAAVRDLTEIQILDASDMTRDEAAEHVLGAGADLVGITTMSVSSVAPAAAFVRALAAGNPRRDRLRIVVGGHGATCRPRPLLDAGADLVLRGEGERSFRALVGCGPAEIPPGAIRLDSGALTETEPPPLVAPLDSLAPPARDLMPVPKDSVHLMETSRGCPHACNFCEATRFFGGRWRGHTPQRVAAEVGRLVTNHGAWIVHFADDNFAANTARVLAICRELRTGPLPAFIMVSARADDLLRDPEVIPALASARILRVSVGVETLDPRMARIAGKTIPAEAYRAVFDRLRNHGIFSVASFITGLPGEDPHRRTEAVAQAVAVAPDAATFVPFVPFVGTPLAAGALSDEPDPAHEQAAAEMTDLFRAAEAVRTRLAAAIRSGGIRGILARGMADKHLD